MPPGSTLSAPCSPQEARSKPKPPPARASRRLSVKSCRITRPRVAPSAERMANSCVRAVERASRRFATFTQAMRRTKPTAASSTSRNGWMSPTTSCLSGISVMPVPLSASGYSSARCRPSASMSAFACSNVTPGLSLPTASMPIPVLRSRKVGSFHWPMGTYTSLRWKLSPT